MLTTPQVEAGLLTLQVGVFSPVSVVADVLQACRTGCAAAVARGGTHITLESARDDSLPVLVEGDRHRVAQVRVCLQAGVCQPTSLQRSAQYSFVLSAPLLPFSYREVVQNLVVRPSLLLTLLLR